MREKTKILIVDDYDINITSLKELITTNDTEIYSATSANKALELLMHHEFALALLDVQMPETNGFELAQIIKGVRKLKQLPIIFVTAQNQDAKTVSDAYKAGAVDLLFKPLDPKVVRAKVSMFVELSQQKQQLRKQVDQLEALKQKAEAANIAKGRFLANMSHEIRTPLSAVLGYSELIDQNASNYEDVKEYCAVISRNGKLLRSLIDSIFDISKIEADKFELSHEEFELGELIKDIESSLNFQAVQKGIELEFVDESVGISHYIGDPTRLKQVFINIIGNAIKFTSEGKVEVVIGLERKSKNKHRLQITVSDEGIGIEQEQAENLFEAFSQADGSNQRKFGGAGLGLAISREITRSMNGDITLLRSVEGEGAIFLIEVELATVENVIPNSSQDKTDSLRLDLEGKKILCVDDSKDNLRLLELILSKTEATVELVTDGNTAIEMVNDESFDLVLMDIQMPIIDGYETTKCLRTNGFTKPIFAVTAHVMAEEHKKCLAVGCDTIIRKPINQQELFKKIQTYLKL